MTKQTGIKIIAQNRRARHDYQLLDTFEAGLVLQGTEIKSIRAHRVSLQRSFVKPSDGELWLYDANIAQYEYGNRENHEPTRPRKLLMHRREINRLIDTLQQKGLTLIPTRMYLRNGRAKIEIALARGKRRHDKRQDLARKDANRRVERALREKYR